MNPSPLRHDSFSESNSGLTHEEISSLPESDSHIAAVSSSARERHSPVPGEHETRLDYFMSKIGNPIKTMGEVWENASQSISEAGRKLVRSTTRNYYQDCLRDLQELREIHLARQEEFYNLGEEELFNNLTAALEAALEAPENSQALYRLSELIERASQRVPQEAIEGEVVFSEATLISGGPSPEASPIPSSQSSLDNDPQEAQERYKNLYQLKALYLGALQKMPEGSDLQEECQRFTDHCEATLKKGTPITSYDYRIVIAHKNWLRGWLSSPEVNGSSYLPNEDFSITKAHLITYTTSQI